MSTQDPNNPGPTSGGNHDDDDKPTVLSIIRGLQNGTASPKSLSIHDRRACVEHLTGEGYSIVEVAEILRVSERTIARDRKAILEANAIEHDPRLSEEMAGRLVREAELTISRMRRVARDKSTPASVKVDAEHRCYLVLSDMVRAMQSLGYLPTAAHQIQADLTHHLDEPPGFDQTLTEVTRLELLLETSGGADDTARQQLSQLKSSITQYSASDQVAQIRESLHKETDNDVEGS